MSKRGDLDRAHRMRKGAIGILECCRCTYPAVQHATSTRHDTKCPAHGIVESAMRAGEYYALSWTESGKP